MKKLAWFWFGSLLLLHLILLLNLQFTAWPEMFSFPYLLNNKFRMYTDFVHAYPPLLTLVLAAFYRMFGYQLWVLQSVTWLLILVADLLIFGIIRQLTKEVKSALSGLFFYVLTQPFLDGNMLWFDTAIVVPVLAGIFFALRKKYFWSGLLLAVAVLTKQTTGLFLVLVLWYVVYQERSFRQVVTFLIAPLLTGLGLIIYLLSTNTLVDFVNWTLIYPSKYWTQFPGYVSMVLTKREWLTLFILGLPVFILLVKLRKKIINEKHLIFILGNFVLAIVIVYPRWSFFHFQTALAFLAILAGFTLILFKHLSYLPILLVFVISFPVAIRMWHEEPRFWSQAEFVTAEVIKRNLGENKSLFLLGPNSGYYVMTNTLPPKPWLDNFGWYWEIPGVATKTLSFWDSNPPDYVLTEPPQIGLWYELGVYRPQAITNWLIKNYNQKELVGEKQILWQRK